jgi:hypothetical protein
MYAKTKGTTKMMKPKMTKKVPVDPTHMHFLNRVQKPTNKLHNCLDEYTRKLSFFFWEDFMVDLLLVARVELPVDLLAFKRFIVEQLLKIKLYSQSQN